RRGGGGGEAPVGEVGIEVLGGQGAPARGTGSPPASPERGYGPQTSTVLGPAVWGSWNEREDDAASEVPIQEITCIRTPTASLMAGSSARKHLAIEARTASSENS